MIKQIYATDDKNTKESGLLKVLLDTGETVEVRYVFVDGMIRFLYDEKYKESIKVGDLYKLGEHIDKGC